MPVVAKFPARDEIEPLVLKVNGDRYRWTADKAAEGVRLEGKTVLVTGGTSGIGIPTVTAMARTGARVIVTARNEAKGADVIAQVKEATGSTVEVWALDLASLRSVESFVSRAKDEGVVFSVVINNAGVMAIPFSNTEDGYETQLQVNYIAPAILFKGLLDGKSLADDARIVVVTSVAVKRLTSTYSLEKLNWDTEADYEKWTAYCYAKAAVVMHCNLLASKLKESGSAVTVNCVHPGGIITGLQSDVTKEEQQQLGWLDAEGTVHPAFKSVQEGASTSVWVALSEEMKGKSGNYCENCLATAKDDFGSTETPLHAARGSAPYLWEEANWTALLAAAEAKVGRKLM
eukprot:TRINITY_DN926_c0_g1_i1.p1 TRINITY_DN926_c0_g1~~TRINITY_DN926_c0_g1_i1.p1  ORF type:complete len:365 (+),score=163.34 TRINITY_DN926_c0_g1_i1:59-1096(+)